MHPAPRFACLALALAATAAFAVPPEGSESKSTAGKVAPSAEAAKPLPAGAKLPAAEVTTLDGKTVPLTQLTGGKPAALIFYRGGWCPYCNRHLQALRDAEAPLKDLGFSLFALSPDLPDNVKDTVKEQELGYTLVSDAKANAMKALGVAFKLDDGTFTKYKDDYGLDLEKWSGETHHILPVPSIFLVDAEGTIRFVHAEPDYSKRLDNEKLLAAAKKVAGKK